MERILTICFIRILNMSITAGYCILAVLLLRLLFRKMPRKYLYILWLAVAFRLVCPVSISSGLSLFNLAAFSEGTLVTQNGTMEYLPMIPETEEEFPEAFQKGISASPEMPQSAQNPVGFGMSASHGTDSETEQAERAADGLLYTNGNYSLLTAGVLNIGKYVWIAGILMFGLYFVGSIWKFRRSVRMAVLTESGKTGARIGQRKGACRADVYECDSLPSPFVMGFMHPRIYLPCDLQGEQREMVLLHEQYHIRRKDHLVKLLAFGILAVYWFHPLVWAAWFGMCRDMEMSCDEKVLEQLEDRYRKIYSMTLLSFASGGHDVGRTSPAFGEHDVKQRIHHVLDFKKPAVWAGTLAVMMIAAVLVMLGTNGRELNAGTDEFLDSTGVEGGEDTDETAPIEEKLYKAKNPYVGDVSANGRLIGVISEALPDCMTADTAFTVRLQTSEEPYEFHFMLKDGAEFQEDFGRVYAPSVLMLALTDNLGVVQWYGYTEEDEDCEFLASLDVQGAEKLCGTENLKAYSESPEMVGKLLALLTEKKTATQTAEEDGVQTSVSVSEEPLFSRDSEEFMDWYSCIPYERYEEAVPVAELDYEAGYEGDPIMTILAQTEDQTVTLYGYCSRRTYGIRGMTIDYRMTPDGDCNHTYLDCSLIWPAAVPGVELYKADYDQDGRDEIALAVVDGLGTGRSEQLMVFETWDTGHLEASVYTKEMYEEEIRELVGVTKDTEENRMIHVIEEGSVLSVPLVSIPYEEDEKIQSIFVDSYVHFHVGEEIVLESTVGLGIKNFPGIWYGSIEEQQDRTLRFRVIYDESRSLGGGYFTLVVQREEER